MPSYRFHELVLDSPVAIPELAEVHTAAGAGCSVVFDVVSVDELTPLDADEDFIEQSTADGSATIVGFGRGVEFVIPKSGAGLTVRHVADADHAALRHLLLDHALPRLLAVRGHFAVHASGVDYHGKTLLFLGASGNGKSSMAAGLHHVGFPLLGDDCFTVTPRPDGTLIALSTYRSLRLLPPSIEQFYADTSAVEFSSMGSTYQKVRLVDARMTEPTPLPLAGIFLLDGNAHSGPPHAVELSGRDGLVALVQNSFRVGAVDGDVLGASLDLATKIASRVPVVALHYERSFDQLEQVHQVIFDSLS